MLTVGEAIAGIAVAWLVTARAAGHLAAHGPLRRRNYRGLEVPTSCGVAVLMGALAGLAVIAVVDVPGGRSDATPWATVVAVTALGFGLLGLWDDVAAAPHDRGWKAHLRALRQGRPTTGAVKLAGGAALAFLIAARLDTTFPHTLLHAALIAMCANLINLLDLRPGRAGKFSVAFLVPCVVGAIVGGIGIAGPLLVVLAAVGAFLPFDLRERSMLGDVGANAIGAVLGVAIEAVTHGAVETAVVVALAALHVAAETPGLSRVIARTPPLAAFDRAGRVQE